MQFDLSHNCQPLCRKQQAAKMTRLCVFYHLQGIILPCLGIISQHPATTHRGLDSTREFVRHEFYLDVPQIVMRIVIISAEGWELT